MSTLADLLDEYTTLSGAQVGQLQRVVGEWQLLADLSFADFLMWIPVGGVEELSERSEFICVAQARPTTAATAHPRDMVGKRALVVDEPQLYRACTERTISQDDSPQWHDTVPVRREGIPVCWRGELIAVLGRDTHLGTPRVPGKLEISYLGCATDLCQMVVDGTFPSEALAADVHTSPRVGDGLIRVDERGFVVFASPNAQSAYHRMGSAADLLGAELIPLTRGLIPDPFDAAEVAERISTALAGEPSNRFETDAGRGAAVLFRALALTPYGKPSGALVLIRDVTEVKRRDRALMSKDATIREIHHRVKNNLQTVAALLRLQSRRMDTDPAREALAESVRRVDAIATVHETLAMSVNEEVNLDEVLDKVLPILGDVSTTETVVTVRREGEFGIVRAEVATPLVLVLSELVQNCFEHAYPPGAGGVVTVGVNRSAKWLNIAVSDEGIGLPEGFSIERTDRLGLQIVRILVESELSGSISLGRKENKGTEASLRIPLRSN
ncbi:sensor histidine kinase [Sciscionella sediminilitoris]|uniref:sensor histidine kinase n=1 Tax=Sciscionella sediminilitoris TaxID=1445613 RepID=UPI0004DF0BDA|nr:PAS domain-containing sensor histidine kinase [Sciscionella sp. SE31]